MIRGIYSAASALIAGLFRQELISHNLANLQTAGFKELTTGLDEFGRLPLARLPEGAIAGEPGTTVGAVSLGVLTQGAVTNFAAGALRETKQPFDLALSGDGFFRIQTPDGERYTRDGRFTRDENGHLVTVDRNLLLDTDGQPLVVPPGEAAIASKGQITVDGQAIGQIGLAGFAQPDTELKRDGQNLFAAVAGAPSTASTASVHQGFIETSNVDVTRAMASMMSVARAYEAAQRAIQLQDEMTGKAVNEIGRV